ncbi:MAG: DUF3592 domain-containing protein [Chloroflexi bacterium]|nr:DUF3592 domain-containing protein [Chloroflexota bacterium]
MSKKKYSIHWEGDEPVVFEVNGKKYTNLEDIPRQRDREKLAAMVEAAEEEEFERGIRRDQKKDMKAGGKNSIDPEKLILGIFSAAAGILLIVALISSVRTIEQLSREKSTTGRVVDIVRQEYLSEQDRTVEMYYFPVVDFASEDGRRHTVQLSEGSSPPSHEVGDVVTILYDRDNPAQARIRSFMGSMVMWILPGITGIIGLGFLAAVILVPKLFE